MMFLCEASSNIFDSSFDAHWKIWKQQHRKSYKNKEEESNRRLIWEANLRYITNHNQEASLLKHTFTLKMNKFGDLSNKEFARIYNNYQMNNDQTDLNLFKQDPNFIIPDSIDWRLKGALSGYKMSSSFFHIKFIYLSYFIFKSQRSRCLWGLLGF
jgi:hypothetical protein